MANATRCEDCGADAPSLGSLQMHRLRYHAQGSASAGPNGGGPRGAPAVTHGERRAHPARTRAALALAVAIVGLIAGGFYATGHPELSGAPAGAAGDVRIVDAG